MTRKIRVADLPEFDIAEFEVTLIETIVSQASPMLYAAGIQSAPGLLAAHSFDR